MLFQDHGKVVFKGVMLVEGQDWDDIAKKFEILQIASSIQVKPFRAYMENGSTWLPFIGRGNVFDLREERNARSHRGRSVDPIEQTRRYIETLSSDLESWFGTLVEVEPIDFSSSPESAIDDFDKVKDILAKQLFAPLPKPPSGQALMPPDYKSDVDPMDELDSLIGLDDVKAQIKKIVGLVSKVGRGDLPCLHMVFRGNPGTGKTTVARIIGEIYGEMGVISERDRFVEVGRDGLVGQFVGTTAPKTRRRIEEAKGGILFIDEAYSLGMYDQSGRDYGQEALAVLVKEMEDSRDDFICIMAGYSDLMDKMLDVNPGLRDRIGFYIDFPDYLPDELYMVFEKFAHDEGYEIDGEAELCLRDAFDQIVRNKDSNFSNGRLVRKIFERIKMNHITSMPANDRTLSASDVESAFGDGDLDLLKHGGHDFAIGFGC